MSHRKRRSVGQATFQGPLSDKTLSDLAQKLGEEWKRICIDLGVNHARLYQIQSDHPFSTHDQIATALIEWRDASSGSPTTVLEALVSALKKERLDLADDLQQRMQELTVVSCTADDVIDSTDCCFQTGVPMTEYTRKKLDYGRREFVETSLFEKAWDCLNHHGSVTLTGGPGDGKTAMACHLLRRHHQLGARVVALQEPTHLKRLLDEPSGKTGTTVVLMDDVFGAFTASRLKMQEWRDPLTSADHCLKSQTFPETQHHFRFIFTSRQLQVNAVESGLDTLRHSLFHEDRLVDMGTLSTADRRRIFLQHATLHDRGTEFSSTMVDRIASLTPPYGFPHICDIFFSRSSLKEKVLAFFSKPLDFVSTSVEQILREQPAQALLLASLVLSDGKLSLEALAEESGSLDSVNSLDEKGDKSQFPPLLARALRLIPCRREATSVTPQEVQESAWVMEGSYVTFQGECLVFRHQIFQDIVCFLLGRFCRELVVRHCSRLFLYERVTLSQGSEVRKWSVRLEPKYRSILVDRFVKEMTAGHFFLVCLHPDLTLPGLAVDLVEALRKKDALKEVLTKDDREGYGPLLVCTTHSQSPALFRQMFKACCQTKELSQACLNEVSMKAVVTQCCLIDNPAPLDVLYEYEINTPFLETSSTVKGCVETIDDAIKDAFAAKSKFQVKALYRSGCWNSLNATQTLLDPRAERADCPLCPFMGEHFCLTTVSLAALLKSNKVLEALLSLTSALSPEQAFDAFLMACAKDNGEAVAPLASRTELFECYTSELLALSAHFGAASVTESMLSLLKEKGLELDAVINARQMNTKMTPVMEAALHGEAEVVRVLLSARDVQDDVEGSALLPICNVRATDAHGSSPLMLAAERGHIDVVRLLLHHSNADAVNEDGETALVVAAKNGHAEIVSLLLPHSNANAATKNGFTALACSSQEGHTATVQLLLQHTDPSAATLDGMTALMLSAEKGHTDVVTILLPRSDARAVCRLGRTALMLAATHGFTMIVEILLPHSDAKVATREGMTALMMAAEKGHTAIVQLLLPHSDVKATTQESITALMVAATNGHAGVVEFLLPFSDAGAVDCSGLTALMLSAEKGDAAMVKLLLPHSDRRAVCCRGRNAVEIAASLEHWDLLDLLSPENSC